MAARLIGFLVMGVVLFALVVVVTYVVAKGRDRTPRRVLDVSVRPSLWWADTQSTGDGKYTKIGIVRVDNKTHEVLERRTMGVIHNDHPDYVGLLDAAQDRAYAAARKANLGLVRR